MLRRLWRRLRAWMASGLEVHELRTPADLERLRRRGPPPNH